MRKAEINKHKRERLLQALRAGNTREASCAHAGLASRTVRRWLERGGAHARAMEQDAALAPTEQSKLWEDVQLAESAAEVMMVALIQRHAATTWQAAAWWLERRRPQDYGRVERRPDLRTETTATVTIGGASDGDSAPDEDGEEEG